MLKKLRGSVYSQHLLVSHLVLVRMTGLEPTHLSIPDPKSGAATNYATSAFTLQRYKNFAYVTNLLSLFSEYRCIIPYRLLLRYKEVDSIIYNSVMPFKSSHSIHIYLYIWLYTPFGVITCSIKNRRRRQTYIPAVRQIVCKW